MGYRHLDEAEFKFIKSLFAKYGDINEIVKISSRSRSTVRYIQASKSFSEYEDIRPGGKNYRPLRSMKKEPLQEYQSTKVIKRDYSGAILSEIVRLRRAINKHRAIYLLQLLIMTLMLTYIILTN